MIASGSRRHTKGHAWAWWASRYCCMACPRASREARLPRCRHPAPAGRRGPPPRASRNWRGRAVKVPAGMRRQPPVYPWGLVGSGVVHDPVHRPGVRAVRGHRVQAGLRAVRVAAAGSPGCAAGPGAAFSRPRTAPGHGPADAGTGRSPPGPGGRNAGPWRAGTGGTGAAQEEGLAARGKGGSQPLTRRAPPPNMGTL